ncbi:GDCCVxC domain-containing (seleno)protein [Polynucleobacter necessarius]|uniref:GDCCVxC domain-containing (seleno)protein n=1 Tax=Polynucleobacter necessarius TaxID=576610 RepID=UPI0039E3B8D8
MPCYGVYSSGALYIPPHLYRCRSCSAILKPKSGDCCILCSFGNRDCSSSEQNLAA